MILLRAWYQKPGLINNLYFMNEESKIKVSSDIWLTNASSFDNLFQKSYMNDLHTDFIENKEDKKHNINSHTK